LWSWLILHSALVSASNFLEWQRDKNLTSVDVNIGTGASLVKLQNSFVVLPGVLPEPTTDVYLIDDLKFIPLKLQVKHSIRPYAATVAYKDQVIVVGGEVDGLTTSSVNALQLADHKRSVSSSSLPDLPFAPSETAVTVLKDQLFVLAWHQNQFRFMSLQLNAETQQQWKELAAPKELMFGKVTLAVQNDGRGDKIYAHVSAGHSSLWQFQPNSIVAEWALIDTIAAPSSDISQLYTLGQAHLLAIATSGETYHYNTITRAWAAYQQTNPPKGQLIASLWSHSALIYLTQESHGISVQEAVVVDRDQEFGWLNMLVLFVYLAGVVLLGLYFMKKNNDTNDFFRGGQSIPWWAAACSIYATMLSSLTYMALPAIVYQTDWVLLIGILTIVAVAPIAVYIAVPFFRQIDATSAYEYLSKRFNLPVRLFASALFTLFHLSRMGVVMALTALAIAAITPLTATESVLLMGVLCLLYCTLGGIEAVIWTDTLQTIVLLLGAIVCFGILVSSVEGGINQFIAVGFSDDKFTLFNADFGASSITTLSLWVVVLGGIGQNLSSYTADQAIVQRYMVTPDPAAAKKSIWTNAIIAAPASVLFFCIGTGLYLFYQAHPGLLNPTKQIDQIFPTFIATQLPVGIAGLIVAGIFAAAQSTVSTSINSIATTLVTDFVRPFNWVKTEQGYMRAAQWFTFVIGVLGTLVGLIFIDPAIRSLMDTYFIIIGMFMGALGGLFVLGVVTRRANTAGAIVGLSVGVTIMVLCWKFNLANGYLYCTIGIISCVVVGYVVSLIVPSQKKDLAGLTLFTMQTSLSASSDISNTQKQSSVGSSV
jgi:SSS family transporter